jgi:hypothetical protein
MKPPLLSPSPPTFAALATLVSLSACVPDFGTDLSEVRGPILLAISASPAETQARKQTTLTALVATPPGRPTVTPAWNLCLARKPLTELGPVNAECLERDAGPDVVQDLGRGASVQATLDADVCKLFGPLRPSSATGAPAGRPVDPDVTGGFYQPIAAHLGDVVSLGAIRIDCDPANIDRDQAVAFRQQYRVNENPRLSSVDVLDGDVSEPLPAEGRTKIEAGSSLSLSVGWQACPSESVCGDQYCTANEDAASCAEDCAPGQAQGCPGAEQYAWYDREAQQVVSRREAISVAWYTSSGHFDNEQTGREESEASSSRSSDNVWRVGEESGDATLWIVVRDSRGGQSWEIRQFEITP